MPTPTPRVSVRTRRVALVTLAIISICLTVTATIVNYQRQQPPVQKINYSQIYGLAEVGGAVALQVEGATLTVTKADGSVVEATVTGEAAQHEVVHGGGDRPVQPVRHGMDWGRALGQPRGRCREGDCGREPPLPQSRILLPAVRRWWRNAACRTGWCSTWATPVSTGCPRDGSARSAWTTPRSRRWWTGAT